MGMHNGTDTVIADGMEKPVNHGTEIVIERGGFSRQQAKMPENN
jgi:hypothetical protein